MKYEEALKINRIENRLWNLIRSVKENNGFVDREEVRFYAVSILKTLGHKVSYRLCDNCNRLISVYRYKRGKGLCPDCIKAIN